MGGDTDIAGELWAQDATPQATERIQKVLSARGVASRREAERMIGEGRVAVNGVTAVIGQKVNAASDDITVDGQPLEGSSKPVYIMLNKPRGFVTTVKDEQGRKTVMSLVESLGTRVYPVGRLDLDSEGLLLMTNDGEFTNAVAHPSGNKAKTYEVFVRGDTEKALPVLRAPMEIDSCIVHAASVELVQKTSDGGVFKVMVYEGRNRQIRKMCMSCGLKVLSLIRLSIGSLELGDLKTGRWRHLTKEEVRSLRG